MISEIIDLPRRGLSLVLLLLLTLTISLSPRASASLEPIGKAGEDEKQIIENTIISEEQPITTPAITPMTYAPVAPRPTLDLVPKVDLPKSPGPFTAPTQVPVSTPKIEIPKEEAPQEVEIVAEKPPLAALPFTASPATDRDFPLYEVYKDGYFVAVPTEWQWFIRDMSEKYGIDERVVFGMITTESTFNTNSTNGGCYGLAQIQNYWIRGANINHFDENYKSRNLKDPYDNITTLFEMWVYAIDTYKLDLSTRDGYVKLLFWHHTGNNPSKITSWSYSNTCLKYADELVPYKIATNTDLETEG
jgi:hypothetical protein